MGTTWQIWLNTHNLVSKENLVKIWYKCDGRQPVYGPVCVYLSHAGIVSKRLHFASRFPSTYAHRVLGKLGYLQNKGKLTSLSNVV